VSLPDLDDMDLEAFKLFGDLMPNVHSRQQLHAPTDEPLESMWPAGVAFHTKHELTETVLNIIGQLTYFLGPALVLLVRLFCI
jgi:hypothetical protein